MSVTACRDCQLPLAETPEHCPECGIIDPTANKASLDARALWLKVKWGSVGTVALGLAGAVADSADPTPAFLGRLLVSVTAGCLIGVIAYVLAKWCAEQNEDTSSNVGGICGIIGLLLAFSQIPNFIPGVVLAAIALAVIGGAVCTGVGHLIFEERMNQRGSSWRTAVAEIERKLHELDEREALIRSTQQEHLVVPPEDHPERRAEILEQALTSVTTERTRYRVHLWNIDLLRWHAHLKSLLNTATPATVEACARALAAVDKVRADGATLLKTWQDSDIAQSPEAGATLQRLDQLLNVAHRLRTAVVDQQVLLVAQLAAPNQGSFEHVLADLREVDKTLIRGELRLLPDRSEQIDAEHARLMAVTELQGDYSRPLESADAPELVASGRMARE